VLSGVKVLAVITGLVAALLVVGAAPATTPVPGQVGALKAIRVALAAGRIDGATANAGRAEITRAAHLVRTLPSGRSEHVAVALEEVAAFSGRLTEPRALALIGQLQANDDYFAKHYAPAPKTDVTDADGLVYRYFPGRCLEFHPLANFGALNARVAANDADGALRLADALIARGVYQQGGGIAWEYFFDYSGGRAPWLSGMAQAVGAQAFARTAALVPDQATALMREARAAYRTIPQHLLTTVPAGPWIRLYSFQSLRVLNAQLQAVISLQSYATAAEDPDAAALAARMQRAAAATLPSFDTGYWTYYSLPHEPSPVDYQQFVVQLLKKLAAADPRFADAATRIAAYQHQPPAFRLANASLGTLRFWLSKPATVEVNSAAGPTRRLALGGGWHTVGWAEPKRPGVYPIHVSAVDWAANRASFDALPIVRATAAGTASTERTSTASAKAVAAPTFSVGAALDDPTQGTTLQKLGLQLARIGVTWPDGATAPDPSVGAALQRLPAGLGSVLELTAAPLPADDAGRAALAQYAATLAQQTPGLRSLVLAPAPATATAGDYGQAFEEIRTAVQTVLPDVQVGIRIDGALAPKATLAALGALTPDIVAFHPAPAAGKGLWTTAELPQLTTALAAVTGTAPPILLDGPPAPSAALISSLGCGGRVSGVLLDQLSQATPAVAAAAIGAQRGALVCPGVAAQVEPTGLAYPTVAALPVSVQFGCSVDCLYLVTLDGPDGRPVVARRGALRGGAAPATIALPAAKLGAGPYRVGVRLVASVNPGQVTTLESPPLG
jgi:D-glucuronyl C5-epimerase C-terminus